MRIETGGQAGRVRFDMRRRNAFTLVELLLVIAVIAILAAVLFPVFAQAKGAAKKTTALSNVGQIVKAATLYVADSDDHLPFRFPVEPNWRGYGMVIFMVGGDRTFPKIYAPYLKSAEVWKSPADRLRDQDSSFAVNEQLAFSIPMSQVDRSAEAIYLTDRSDVPRDPPAGDAYAWWTFTREVPFTEASLPGKIDPVAVATQIDPIRYVGNVAVYGYLDAHAAALPFAKTWGDAAHNQHLALKP